MLLRGGTVRRASLLATSRTRAGREHACCAHCRASWRRLPLTLISNTAAARNATPLRANNENTKGRRSPRSKHLRRGSRTGAAEPKRPREEPGTLGLRRIFAHQETDEAYEKRKKSSDLIARRTGYRRQSEHLCDLVQKVVIDLPRCGIVIGHGGRCILCIRRTQENGRPI